MRHFWQKAADLEITICYSSVYGDKWQVTRRGFKSDDEQPKRKQVDDCAAAETVFLM